jgi:hypothetical protein
VYFSVLRGNQTESDGRKTRVKKEDMLKETKRERERKRKPQDNFRKQPKHHT